MTTRIDSILDTLAGVLNGMAGVFSTPQWGGRAYKVGRDGKGKILAFVAPGRAGDAVTVSFKIPPDDAEAACERHGWIEPHSFRTLAPSGWLTATVSTRRQAATLTGMLVQSHALHTVPAVPAPPAAPSGERAGEPDPLGRVHRVMGKARDEGWAPRSDW